MVLQTKTEMELFWQIRTLFGSENQNPDYTFSGQCLVTRGVHDELPAIEIKQIVEDVYSAVTSEGKIDYLQVYKKGDQKIFVIDQLSNTQLEGDDYTEEQKKEYNYFTVLFPSEY